VVYYSVYKHNIVYKNHKVTITCNLVVFINYVVFVDGIIYHYIRYNRTGWLLSNLNNRVDSYMFRPPAGNTSHNGHTHSSKITKVVAKW